MACVMAAAAAGAWQRFAVAALTYQQKSLSILRLLLPTPYGTDYSRVLAARLYLLFYCAATADLDIPSLLKSKSSLGAAWEWIGLEPAGR